MAKSNREILARVYESYGMDELAYQLAKEDARFDSVIIRLTLMAMNLAREDENEGSRRCSLS